MEKRNVIAETKMLDFKKAKDLETLTRTLTVLFGHYIVDDATEKKLCENALSFLIVEKKLKKEGVKIMSEEVKAEAPVEETPVAAEPIAEPAPTVEEAVEAPVAEEVTGEQTAEEEATESVEPETATAE